MLDFVYQNQTRIVFGRNAIEAAGTLTRAYGKRALIVYGGGSCVRSGLMARVRASLDESGVDALELGGVQPNPKMGLAYEGIERCKRERIDCIIAIGGGSVIDTAKTIGLGACYDGDAWDFFCGKQAVKTLPVGVVLTLPAAGSENSMDAVMTLEACKLKRASCAGDFIRPVFALENPEITFTLSPYQTACGACDMIAHALERYFTPTEDVALTDELGEAIVRAVMRASLIALDQPDDYAARAELMLSGTYAHNNITGVGRRQDWASHAMGHEISALTDAAHGATLAVMMPAWMRYVSSQKPRRFARWANRVMDVPYWPGDEAAMAAEGISRFQRYLKRMGLPSSLRELGLSESDIPLMASKCGSAGSYVPLDEKTIAEIYRLAL